MPKRTFIKIKKSLFDMWHLVSVEGDDDDCEYNDITGQMDWLLHINRTAVSRDFREKTFRFADKDERDFTRDLIELQLRDSPNIMWLGETDDKVNAREDDGIFDEE
jgi:hypothetical protein